MFRWYKSYDAWRPKDKSSSLDPHLDLKRRQKCDLCGKRMWEKRYFFHITLFHHNNGYSGRLIKWSMLVTWEGRKNALFDGQCSKCLLILYLKGLKSFFLTNTMWLQQTVRLVDSACFVQWMTLREDSCKKEWTQKLKPNIFYSKNFITSLKWKSGGNLAHCYYLGCEI